jgi:hypothetical protein
MADIERKRARGAQEDEDVALLEAPEALAAAVAIPPPDLSNLSAAIEEARLAALDMDSGPADPTDFNTLRGRLEATRLKLPPIYRDAVWTPYVAELDRIGPNGFNQILINDPSRESNAGLMLDIAHAILQNGERYQENATDAFQEVVSDLYDGFLSAEDRRGINPPERGTLPPLVKWGQPDFGPYTWPADATEIFDAQCAIVNLPPANARRGVLAWAALAHETAGHDILHADEGLDRQLAAAVWEKLSQAGFGPLAEYWSDRIDETASDVLGILNMGPAAGVGLIGYFRALNAAFTGTAQLRNTGPAADPHPADIVRGYLAAATTKLLKADTAARWATLIEAETDKDARNIRLAGVAVPTDKAKRCAQLVAEAIVTTRLAAIENHALGEVQNWRNHDERIVARLRRRLIINRRLAESVETGTYAAHAVAAGVMSAIAAGTDTNSIFGRMVAVLKLMHDKNPAWGPLYVRHPGNLARHVAYLFDVEED